VLGFGVEEVTWGTWLLSFGVWMISVGAKTLSRSGDRKCGRRVRVFSTASYRKG
jgi:hypothetical protein